MMTVFINPGSGPVDNATAENAAENMNHFNVDCGGKWKWVAIPDLDYGEGRFAFLMWQENTCYEIQMPGLPLDQVRYIDGERQNIWDYPRLYVDGSSWVWKYAILRDPTDTEAES